MSFLQDKSVEGTWAFAVVERSGDPADNSGQDSHCKIVDHKAADIVLVGHCCDTQHHNICGYRPWAKYELLGFHGRVDKNDDRDVVRSFSHLPDDSLETSSSSD